MKKSLLLALAATAAILLIKLWIRPALYWHPGWGFLLGVAPNGLSALAFPAVWASLRHHKGIRRITPAFCHELWAASLVALLAITGNEVCQLHPVFGRTFDWYDLIFTLLGLLAGNLLLRPQRSHWPALQPKLQPGV